MHGHDSKNARAVLGSSRSVLRGTGSNRRPPDYETGELPLLYPASMNQVGREPRKCRRRPAGTVCSEMSVSTSAVKVSVP